MKNNAMEKQSEAYEKLSKIISIRMKVTRKRNRFHKKSKNSFVSIERNVDF